MALSGTDRIAAEGDFLGHPRGLTFLFATEMWERARRSPPEADTNGGRPARCDEGRGARS